MLWDGLLLLLDPRLDLERRPGGGDDADPDARDELLLPLFLGQEKAVWGRVERRAHRDPFRGGHRDNGNEKTSSRDTVLFLALLFSYDEKGTMSA